MKIWKAAAPLALLAAPAMALAGPVDINSADAETISNELRGIGLSKAEAIVEYRRKHGPFKSAADLSLVKGIGERTVEINAPDIRIGPVKQR